MIHNFKSGQFSAFVLSAAVCISFLGGPSQAQDTPDYQDNELVSERYVEPTVEFDTPAFADEDVSFSTHEEVIDYINALAKDNSYLRIDDLGKSQAGRDIPVLLLSANGTEDDFNDASKPTVLLLGQQHGNEPAGSEAMLVIARELSTGALSPLLDKINVVIFPRTNPDGAANDARTTENEIDVNRDHVLNRTPEGRAIGLAFQKYQPQVVMDAHEFTVGARWIKAFGGVQRPDAMIQYATIANLSQHLIDLQENIFRQSLMTALDQNGLVADWYYTTNSDGSSQELRMGGIAPTVGRNIAGLRGAVSFLMETRGVGIGTQHYKRRVYTHVIGITSILQTTAENAALILAETDAARMDIAGREPGEPFVILSSQAEESRNITFVDPENGEDLTFEVVWKSSLNIDATLSRPRPAAYVLGPENTEAAQKLEALGAEVTSLTAGDRFQGTSYEIVELAEGVKLDVRGVDTSAGTIIKGKFDTLPVDQIDLADGGFLIRMDQPLASLIGTVLEPENTSGYVANRVIPVTADVIQGLYRVETADALTALEN